MYAVIQTGGKQYRAQPGDLFQIEHIQGDVGSSIKFDRVLLMAKENGDQAPKLWLGKPEIKGATVSAEIVGQGRGEKILIIKMKRRKQYRRTQGHRQWYTQVLITAVDNGSGESALLSDEDKKLKLSQFQSHLKMPGQGPKQRAETQSLSTEPNLDTSKEKTAKPRKTTRDKTSGKKVTTKKKK